MESDDAATTVRAFHAAFNDRPYTERVAPFLTPSLSVFQLPFGPAEDEGVPYPSDLADEQWALLEPLLVPVGKRGRKHTDLGHGG